MVLDSRLKILVDSLTSTRYYHSVKSRAPNDDTVLYMYIHNAIGTDSLNNAAVLRVTIGATTDGGHTNTSNAIVPTIGVSVTARNRRGK